MHDTLLMISLVAAVFAVPGCADDISPAGGPDAGEPAPGDPDAGPPPPVDTVRDPDGSYVTRIDSTSYDLWRYVDLETGKEVAADGPWDLATQRYHVQLNGGVSGRAGAELVAIPDVGFDSVTAAPATGWITDAADGDDDNLLPDLAFEQGKGWYQYLAASHVLEPWPIVWVVRTGDDTVVKLVFESYYDDAGTAGHLRLRWKPLAAGGAP
jgi:hypothetical protein